MLGRRHLCQVQRHNEARRADACAYDASAGDHDGYRRGQRLHKGAGDEEDIGVEDDVLTA